MSRNDILNSLRETIEATKEEVIASGTTQGYDLGLILGKAEGHVLGYAEGYFDGQALGISEGKAQGELLKAKEIAVKLLATGLSKSEVAEIVGLDESELDIA